MNHQGHIKNLSNALHRAADYYAGKHDDPEEIVEDMVPDDEVIAALEEWAQMIAEAKLEERARADREAKAEWDTDRADLNRDINALTN